MLDGDHVVALNPPPAELTAYLHDTLALLVAHHLRAGYEHVVINHIWETPAALDDLHTKLRTVQPTFDIRTFLLTLPLEQNLMRIAARQRARAFDEAAFEHMTVEAERRALYEMNATLGEPFDVSDPPEQLVSRMLTLLGLPTEPMRLV
jgi:hypothetical protein